jgi:hypothetical protein
MASDVDICNLALGNLGDTATVASIDPPEGSAQAGHCSRFYPIARDALLEMHPWNFATKRVTLALLDVTPPSAWAYAYAVPADAVGLVAVLDAEAGDDYSAAGLYTPQPYQVETLDDADVIYTNVENAVLRYTGLVTDTTKFSPLFIVGLAMLLTSMLAGPVLKGEVGRSEARAWLKEFQAWYASAAASDANDGRTQTTQQPTWVANR